MVHCVVYYIAESSQMTQNTILDSSEEVITYSLGGPTRKTVKVRNWNFLMHLPFKYSSFSNLLMRFLCLCRPYHIFA